MFISLPLWTASMPALSWPLEVDALDAHSCDTETLWSVTWRLWVLTQTPGKTSQLIGHNGEQPWPSTSKQEKTSWHKPPHRGGPAESFVSALFRNSQHAYATLATRTAIHASVFTVIVADAPAKHTTRMLYPWSTLTDGGLLCPRQSAGIKRWKIFRNRQQRHRCPKTTFTDTRCSGRLSDSSNCFSPLQTLIPWSPPAVVVGYLVFIESVTMLPRDPLVQSRCTKEQPYARAN